MRFIRWILGLVALVSFPMLAYCYLELQDTRAKLRDVTRASALHAIAGIEYASRVDSKDSSEVAHEKAYLYVAHVITLYSIHNLKDRRAAIVVQVAIHHFPEIESWVGPREKTYLSEMDLLWRGKTLGFP